VRECVCTNVLELYLSTRVSVMHYASVQTHVPYKRLLLQALVSESVTGSNLSSVQAFVCVIIWRASVLDEGLHLSFRACKRVC
jgi:hypothetical protein